MNKTMLDTFDLSKPIEKRYVAWLKTQKAWWKWMSVRAIDAKTTGVFRYDELITTVSESGVTIPTQETAWEYALCLSRLTPRSNRFSRYDQNAPLTFPFSDTWFDSLKMDTRRQ